MKHKRLNFVFKDETSRQLTEIAKECEGYVSQSMLIRMAIYEMLNRMAVDSYYKDKIIKLTKTIVTSKDNTPIQKESHYQISDKKWLEHHTDLGWNASISKPKIEG